MVNDTHTRRRRSALIKILSSVENTIILVYDNVTATVYDDVTVMVYDNVTVTDGL